MAGYSAGRQTDSGRFFRGTEREGKLSVLELPWDRPPTAHRDPSAGAAGSVAFDVPAESVRALRELADERGSGLSRAMLAMYVVLLYRYSGQTDIAVAVSDGAEPSSVTSVNLLPERPFTDLVHGEWDDTTPAADASRVVPLPRFSFRRASGAGDVGHVHPESAPAFDGSDCGDMELRLVEEDDKLAGCLVYATDVFDEATARRAVGHFLRLVGSVCAEVDRPVSALAILTPEEARAFDALNGLTVQQPDRTFHQLFEEQVERTPDRTAVRAEDAVLTFQELNRYANQLAHLLREWGAGPGTTVGIHVDRTARAVVALLAVLKAGGAYVPVDVREPAVRSDAILRDAGVVAEIGTVPGVAAAQGGSRRPTIELNADWTALAGRPVHNPSVPDSALTDAAYVLYTSGTTGQPKGVIVENRHLVSYVRAIVARLGVDAPMNWAVLQPLSVDSSVTALMPPLCTGGEAQLISRERALDPEALADWAREWGIDCMKVAPSHLRALQASPRFRELLPRERLVVGCEASDWQWLRELQQLMPDCQVFNHYGPTETTVGVLTLAVGEHMDGDWDIAPIGFPLPGTQVHVVDGAGSPVPAGVVGEIAIGGNNVARGYHRRDELSAAVFVPDTLGDDSARRLYLTGDFARRRPDGMITFLGRRDDQVKVRGFRVALGEIDAALRNHPDVRNAVALTREDGSGGHRLVAYVEPHSPASFRTESLDGQLRERLPSHMIPQAVVVMDELPLSANGKVNRSALPPVPETNEAEADVRPPASELQRMVADVWRDVLRTEVSGIDQNFFDAGGHSLLLVTLQQGLHQASGRKVDILQLLRHPTVRAQAELLARPGEDLDAPISGRRPTAQQNALTRRRNEQLRARRGRS